jgi:hypothetical protein
MSPISSLREVLKMASREDEIWDKIKIKEKPTKSKKSGKKGK